ncbi:MAG: YciI family protein [Polyangiaceae bacterium]
MTYVLLIYRASLNSGPTAKEERVALRGHRALQDEASARGKLRAVARLDDTATARTVKRDRSGAHAVSDGPYVETKEWLVGFYLVDCAAEQQAIEHAKSICTDEHHAVEVRPVTWAWKP